MPDQLHVQYLQAMGIDVWVPRTSQPDEFPAETDSASQNAGQVSPELADMDSSNWDTLTSTVMSCQKCGLHKTRTNVVFGVGNPHAEILFVGEAPGADEDKQGEPFVGRAGKLLNAMLSSIGLRREQVFIANILKCRPPNNREPDWEEAETCMPYLIQQINLIQPKLIVALGRISAQRLLAIDTPLGKLRGAIHTLPAHDIPVLATYHPAYLLRSPQEKQKAWQDMLKIRQWVTGQSH